MNDENLKTFKWIENVSGGNCFKPSIKRTEINKKKHNQKIKRCYVSSFPWINDTDLTDNYNQNSCLAIIAIHSNELEHNTPFFIA